MAESKASVHRCAACSAPNARKRCSQCNITYYCSPECQRNAWPSHKVSCVSIAASVTAPLRPFEPSAKASSSASLDKMIENDYMDPKLADRMREKIDQAEAKGKPIDLCGISHEMGFRLIHHAALKGLTPVVKLLLEKGVPVDIRNSMQETSLQLACMYGHIETAKLLIDYGANPSVTDVHGYSIPYRVKNGIFGKQKAPEILKLLADAEAAFKNTGAEKKAEKKRIAGNEAFGRMELDAALELYAESLRSLEDYRTYSNRAAVHLVRRNYDAALTDATRATALHPDFPRAWIRKIHANMGFRDFPRVRMNVEDAIKAVSDPKMKAKFEELRDLLIARGVPDRISNGLVPHPRRDEAQTAMRKGDSVVPCGFCRYPLPADKMRSWESCPFCACDCNAPGIGQEFDDVDAFIKNFFA